MREAQSFWPRRLCRPCAGASARRYLVRLWGHSCPLCGRHSSA